MTHLFAVLADPAGTLRRVTAAPAAWPAAAALLVLAAGLGLATLPRQLALLGQALPLTGDPALDGMHLVMRAGLRRLIVLDRVVPSPTLLFAALAVGLGAEPVLALSADRRRALWAVVVVGLAPLLVWRLGELAITWLLPVGAAPPAAHAILLPSRFMTGPGLLWLADAPRPGWLETVDARLNLMTLWVVALWSMGLMQLDRAERLAAWHLALPLGALVSAGLLTWAVGPVVLAAVLGTP